METAVVRRRKEAGEMTVPVAGLGCFLGVRWEAIPTRSDRVQQKRTTPAAVLKRVRTSDGRKTRSGASVGILTNRGRGRGGRMSLRVELTGVHDGRVV